MDGRAEWMLSGAHVFGRARDGCGRVCVSVCVYVHSAGRESQSLGQEAGSCSAIQSTCARTECLASAPDSPFSPH